MALAPEGRHVAPMGSDADSGTWDCIIVGAGPADLNAALVLGRARRRVLVLDGAQPRNYGDDAADVRP